MSPYILAGWPGKASGRLILALLAHVLSASCVCVHDDTCASYVYLGNREGLKYLRTENICPYHNPSFRTIAQLPWSSEFLGGS